MNQNFMQNYLLIDIFSHLNGLDLCMQGKEENLLASTKDKL